MTYRESVMDSKLPDSRGLTLLRKHLTGGRLCASEAIRAKCADCMAFFIDGRRDCENPDCPLFPWRPYRKNTATGAAPETDSTEAVTATDGDGESGTI